MNNFVANIHNERREVELSDLTYKSDHAIYSLFVYPFCQLCPDLALLVIHSCILDCGKESHNSRPVQIGLIAFYVSQPFYTVSLWLAGVLVA